MKLVGLFLCSSVFLAVILNKVKCEEYLGCYKDGDDPERLLGHLRYFHDSLTPQVCITYCTGYAYAGLQDGNQCFCGDDEPNDSKKTEDKECDHRCTGDRSQICGGDWRDTVYKLTHAIKAAVGNIPFTYLGCYTDQANPRMLQGSFKDFGDYMTPLQCVNFCKDAGYHYAGLQYRTQCFCGDQTPKIEDKVSEKRCVARCSGDITSICGGNWKSTVYATGLTKVSTVGNIGYKYEGCFRDVEESRRLGGFKKDFGENLVPKDCIELCKSYGYHYAGLQFRIECFCGDELLRSDKRPDTECLEKCSGDVTQLCGAGFRNTVYNTGLSVKANIANIGYTYLGCYKDQADPRLLQGYFKDFGDYLSPLACVEFCKNLGYIHAGVEYRTQCFCGDQKLESKYKVPDTECKSRCGNEDINSICGGGWKASVYSTGLTQVARVEDIGYKYEGCYRDNVDNRRLNAFEESFEDNLVPKKCLDLCKHNGYLFAGLQNRVECFCGDADLLPSDKIPDSECQHRCSGDITKICGGSSKNTVYSTGNTVKASIADIGFSYLGCYRDSSEKRRIQGDYKEFEEDLTPEICVNYCKKLDYKYAGMQYSKECYCGNDQPLIQDKIDDSECRARCSGDNTNYCGGNFRNTIYSTNLPGSLNGSNVPCEVSVTTVNGYKPTCKGEVVFFDNFSGTSISNKWSHVVQIANEWDSEFVVYKKEASTSYTNDGHLVIKPIVLSDSNITSGRILLSGCTGIVGTDQCEKQAKAYLILPPVESARLISRNSFSFRYGRVDIRAKLPKGDWLVPDILLESKGNTYGTDDSHSRIRISMSRGNQDLLLDEIDLSCKSLEVGIAIGEGRNTRRLTTVFKNPNECWHLQYHDFSLIWSNGNITFVVDGTQTSSTIKTEDGNFTNGAGLNKDVLDLWSGDTNSPAFDSDFYITLGVSVGGGINFPDNIINRGRNKPWMNSELKHTLNFWKDRKNWERTWSVDSALHVDYVKVTAL